MKRAAVIIVLSTGLLAGPAMAADPGNDHLLSNENVGGAVGAAVGGFLGSKIGDGKGRAVTTAAGAVGGWLVGQKVAHNYNGNGNSNRRSYHRSHDRRDDQHGKRGHDRPGKRGYDRHDKHGYDRPRVRPINGTFVARTTSNVRAGPSTRFHVTGRLHRNERVRVVGKVSGGNWFVINNRGRRGFVYAPLLKPEHQRYGGHSRYDNDRHYNNGRRGNDRPW